MTHVADDEEPRPRPAPLRSSRAPRVGHEGGVTAQRFGNEPTMRRTSRDDPRRADQLLIRAGDCRHLSLVRVDVRPRVLDMSFTTRAVPAKIATPVAAGSVTVDPGSPLLVLCGYSRLGFLLR
jgi:hypothetical protein